MSIYAIGLVLCSSVSHVLWNFLAKTSPDKNIFIWWMLVVRSFVLLPFAFVDIQVFRIPLETLAAASISALIFVGNFSLLGIAYSLIDFSIAYPLSRAFPLFVPIWAVLFLSEKLSLLGILGILLIGIGTYTVNMHSFTRNELLRPIRALKNTGAQAALGAALLASISNVIDKWAVNTTTPLTYTVWFFIMTAVLDTLYIIIAKRGQNLSPGDKKGWIRVLFAGLLASGYFLIIFTISTAPVSYVQAVRQVSVVIGAIMGILYLKESYWKMRVVSSILICLGAFLIGIA